MCIVVAPHQLLVHDDVRGLQVLEPQPGDSEDIWIDVPRVVPQQIVVQIGQITQRWTNDEYRATVGNLMTGV